MPTKNFAEVIRRKLRADLDLASAVEAERFSANVAEEIYSARIRAGLTQRQLAERVKTQQSAIARLEDSDYEGHSLKMLERIAFALGARVEIRFITQSPESQSTAAGKLSVDSSLDEGWGDYPEITTTAPDVMERSLASNAETVVV